MSVWTVLLAAGSGTRLASAAGGVKKQFLRLDGRPLYWRSLRAFARCPEVAGVVVVFPPADLAAAQAELDALRAREDPGVAVVTAPGGVRRQDSVASGLAALPRACRFVLVHDAARPFADPPLIGRVIDALLAGKKAVIPVLPVTDTIKEMSGGVVARTFDRNALAAVQTPQGFELSLLRQAFAHAGEDFDVTDDASLVEHFGQDVTTVAGASENRKITNPEDLALLAASPAVAVPVVGYGYDVHRYADPARPGKQPARPMKLGGYPILGAPEVLAHSDGDVLLHALVDAILGCVAGGDIGALFPDSNPDFDNMASGVFVSEALLLAKSRGLAISHVDLTVICQIPRIGPHAQAIRLNVAALLGLDRSQVNVKATTEEGLGFTGEKKGIKAVALVTGWRQAGQDAAAAPGS